MRLRPSIRPHGRGGLIPRTPCAILLMAGWAGVGCLAAGTPLRTQSLDAIDAAVEQAIARHQCPGGVLWLECGGGSYQKAYGSRALVPAREAMRPDTIFDVASLTKVMACTPAIMVLVERGQVSLDACVADYIGEFSGGERDRVTLRHLLTHTSGLPPGLGTNGGWSGWTGAIEQACGAALRTPPGETFCYSDVGFILLGEVVRRVSGTSLDGFVRCELYEPLRMHDTGYLPPGRKLNRVAPTEVMDGIPLRGVVHDPTARRMGGVAGHAGLFSTTTDVARYVRLFLNRGELEGVRLFQPETVDLMTRVQTPPRLSVKRGLGWDLESDYSGPRGELFPPGSYGHSGWTGSSLWIDPGSGGFVIFLSNRNHPDETGSVRELRRTLGTLAAEAMGLGPLSATGERRPSDPAGGGR